MDNLLIHITPKRYAKAEKGASIVRDNTDYVVQFDFADGSGFTTQGLKTAIFVTTRGKQPVTFSGTTCAVPMMTEADGSVLKVGVVQGELKTSSRAHFDIVDSITTSAGDDVDPVTPDAPLADSLTFSDLIKVNIALSGETKNATLQQVSDLIGGGGGSSDAVLYTEQTLTSAQQVQARSNIGAYSSADAASAAQQIAAELRQKANTADIPAKTSQLTNDSGYITSDDIPDNVSAFENDAGYITNADIPTAVSELTNDEGFVDATGAANAAPVQSVNGQTGEVMISIPTVPSASSALPLEDGIASAGSSTAYAKGDHRHPHDTSKQDVWMYSSVTIAVADWEASGYAYAAVKTVAGITPSSLVFVKYSDTETAFTEDVTDADEMTFGVTVLPSAAITVDVTWFTESAR